MSDIPPIETARLQLISLSCGLLQQMVDRRVEEVGRTAGFTIPDPCSMAGQSWLERRIRMIEEDSAQHPWLNRAVVRKEDNQMVGNISFHHKAPDPHLLGQAEVAAELGYTIEAPYRRNGYATEGALGMMEWAHREHGVRTFVLSISPANLPSLRMAEAMNFLKVGEHLDEVDGLEWVMRAEIDEIPPPPCADLTRSAPG